MNASNGKKHERRFLDVKSTPHGEGLKPLGWLGNHGQTVNLKPAFYKRYPFWAAVLVIFAVALLFFVRNISTRAEVADFYPSTCLGIWQNPSNAQDEPENLVSVGAPAVFDASNSAILAPSVSGQIYCGGFVPPDYKAGGEINGVGLTFVWQMEFSAAEVAPAPSGAEGQVPAAAPTVNPIVPSSTTPEPVSPAGGGASSTEQTVPVMPAPSGTEGQSTTQSFWFGNLRYVFISPAFAQESSDASSDNSSASEAAPDSASAGSNGDSGSQAAPASSEDISSSTAGSGTESPVNSVSGANPSSTEAAQETTSTTEASETVIIGPPLSAELGPVATGTEEASGTPEIASGTLVTSTLPVVEPAPPDENFLKISYSTDGQTWAELAMVNEDNWRNLTVSLPVGDWDDLEKIQVRVESIPTTIQPPRVYLDGILMEVHYEATASPDLQFLYPISNGSSTPAAGSAEPSFNNAPNPFPGLPQSALPEGSGLNVQKKYWGGGEEPTINIDIGDLPSTTWDSLLPSAISVASSILGNVSGSGTGPYAGQQSSTDYETQTSTAGISAAQQTSNESSTPSGSGSSTSNEPAVFVNDEAQAAEPASSSVASSTEEPASSSVVSSTGESASSSDVSSATPASSTGDASPTTDVSSTTDVPSTTDTSSAAGASSTSP